MVEDSEDVAVDSEQQLDAEDVSEETLQLSSETIRDASPFNKLFHEIAENTKAAIGKGNNNSTSSLFCPEIVSCLLNRFMYIIPLCTSYHVGQGLCLNTIMNTR